MVAVSVSLRLIMANGSRLGPGKVQLLEAIGQHRSISEAARQLGMSYRRAWMLVDDLNRTFNTAVVVTVPGRSRGGGSTLTTFGCRLVVLYRTAEQASVAAVAAQLEEIAAALGSQTDGELTRRPRPKAVPRDA